jgi:hypothetical protein
MKPNSKDKYLTFLILIYKVNNQSLFGPEIVLNRFTMDKILTWKVPMYLESTVATQLERCTKGPSLPRGIPAPRVAVRPTTFATRVLDN